MAKQEKSPASALTVFPTITPRARGKAACAHAGFRAASARTIVWQRWKTEILRLSSKQAFQSFLDNVNRFLAIVNGPKRGAVHHICVVLGDYEIALFNPFQ
jgi:hypothetical protein